VIDELKSKRKSLKHSGGFPIFPARATALFFTAFLLLCALGASRVTTVEDITALLPQKDGDSSLIGLARRWGMMQKVIVIVGPDEPSSERLHRALDALGIDLAEVDGVGGTLSGVDMARTRRTAEVIVASAFRLARTGTADLSPEEIKKRLKDLKNRLAAPEAMVLQEYLLKDPLGLSRQALSGLEASGESFGAVVDRGHLLSADKRFGLIIAETSFNPLDISRSTRFLTDLEFAIKKSLHRIGADDLKTTELGGVHYAAYQARSISSDVKQAFILTPLLVILIFGVFFRRIRLLPAALLPGGIGIAAALGAMGLAGQELHALTLGFAATITGISVDYAIHLLHRAVNETGTAYEKTTKALRAVVRPVTLGCLTTLGAFILVSTSSFTGIRQMALFASISVPVAMLATVFGLPAFHRFLLGKDSGGEKTGLSRFTVVLGADNPTVGRLIATAAAFALFLAAGLFGSARVGLSGDPRDLARPNPKLEKAEQTIRGIFPGLFDQALLAARGGSVEKALQVNDAVFDRLLKAGVEKKQVISISPYLPSRLIQERSLGEVKKLFAKNTGDTSLKEIFFSLGFKKDYFEEVEKGIQTGPIDLESFKGTSLEQLLADTVKKEGEQYYVLTRVRAGDDAALTIVKNAAESVEGCRIASERLYARSALTTLQNELVRMLAIWLGAAIVLLSLIERSLFFGLKATLPAIFGVTSAVGLFGLIGRPLTPVASAGVTLVMGLGIDYGIFALSKNARPPALTAKAVTASALTTMAAFGVLAAAETQAMADLGLIIMVGMSAALVTALFLLPAISREIPAAALVASAVLLLGCGARPITVEQAEPRPEPVKMRHQIMFSQGEETHVFEGYMILAGDSFVVKAFAGPGVDLFTVVRSGAKHREELHIPSLKDRIDVSAVSEDIARVYLGGCKKPRSPCEAQCDFYGEGMIEVTDAHGRLTERRFPEAHGIGMTIRYEEYTDYSGRLEPAKISLAWGKSTNLMVIRLLTLDPLDKVDPGIFEIP
jgi:predicted exporter